MIEIEAKDFLKARELKRSPIWEGPKTPLSKDAIKSLNLDPNSKWYITLEVIHPKVEYFEKDVYDAIEMAYLEGQRDMLKDVSAVCDVSEFTKDEK